MRAKSDFGRRAVFGDWVSREYENLSTVYEAGADVPRPFSLGQNVILMEYIGNADDPAPLLLSGGWTPYEAQRLFDQILDNVEVFLSVHRIHGDLSPYNVLVWRGATTLIDLPQAVDARFNPNALELLKRDLERIVGFFSSFGVSASALDLAIGLWTRYQRAEL